MKVAMSEKIEVVARALCRAECAAYEWTDEQHDMWWFDDDRNTKHERYRNLARAAIEALDKYQEE